MITFVRNVFGGVLTVIDLAVKSEAMGRAYAANAARSSWLDRQEEASEVLEPRSFVCNTRAAVPVADPADSLLRFNGIECDVCATEHADFPGARIACGTPGCPNSSHPSAPGIPHRSAADRPEPIARADARGSGHQTSLDVAAGSQQRANVVGGVASADDLLPGVGAGQPPLCLAKDPTAGYLCTADKGHGGAHEASDGAEIVTRWSNGSGQPLDREAHDALHEAAAELDARAKSSSWQDRIRLIALAAEIRDLAHQFEADAQAEGA